MMMSIFLNVYSLHFLQFDPDLYVKGEGSAHANTSNLNDELGQVQFIFSDKTGTLTQNEMKFQAACIGTKTFTKEIIEDLLLKTTETRKSEIVPENLQISEVHYQMMFCVCLCNEVYPDVKDDSIVYRTESPDEVKSIVTVESTDGLS